MKNIYTLQEWEGKYFFNNGHDYKEYFGDADKVFDELIKLNYEVILENKNELIQKVHSKYQKIIDNIKKTASSYEVETWTAQNTEWTSYVADNSANTPFVDALATARGITRDELMTKIGNKVTAVASTLGAQQKLEDQIKACTTQDELDAIVV